MQSCRALLLFAAFCVAAHADSVLDVRGAVSKTLVYLQRTTLTWKEDHGCASCHHAPMMLWTSLEARKKGYAVDAGATELVRQWLLAEDNSARLLAAKDGPADRYVFSLASTYTVLALAAGSEAERDTAALDRFREHYVAKQEADGSYLINGAFAGTPPILEGGGSATCMAVLALAALPGLTPPQQAAADKAVAWLAKPTGTLSQQERSLRLLTAARAVPATDIEAQAMALLSLQLPDGSWSQAPDSDGDAYATGQALVALGAVGMRLTEGPIAEAIAYLVRTQAGDGSWPMVSRTKAPDGSGARNLEPITAAAAAWAALGLLGVS